jgi:hypothetical protein
MSGQTPERPRRRRLFDKIFVAFQASCDKGALDIAARLLNTLDEVLSHPQLPTAADRRKPTSLAALRSHLWRLRYPSSWNTNALGLD